MSFYTEIPSFDRFEEVAEERHYRRAPDDWRIVITDVRGSTKAIEAGRYKDVNALGVASIVALVNALPGVDIPYTFGGDGATLLVPGDRAEEVDAALRGVRKMAVEAFEMEMRVSAVPIAELHADGFEVAVARYQLSEHIYLAMFRGSGLTEAERRIKDVEIGARYAVDDDPGSASAADFTGFECRWQEIPSRHGTSIAVLVQANAEDRAEAAEVYGRVVRKIVAIQDENAPGRPVAPETLHLQGVGDGYDQEARIRSGAGSGLRFWVRHWSIKLVTQIGKLLMNKRWNALGFPGQVYREQVTANTDFRKFDDVLRMVLDVTEEQLSEMDAMLRAEHEAGELVYGIHRAPGVLMTCVIGESYMGSHLHFVDGAQGGYAMAAKQMKAQMAGPAGDRRTRKHTIGELAARRPEGFAAMLGLEVAEDAANDERPESDASAEA